MRNYFVRIILGILLLVFTYREALGIVQLKSGKEVYEAWKNVNIYEDKESILDIDDFVRQIDQLKFKGSAKKSLTLELTLRPLGRVKNKKSI